MYGATLPNNMLGKLRVAAPCSANWEKMVGDDRMRYCTECKLNVYNFSEMTASEIQQLVTNNEGRLCGRLYRRSDGTILTRDCPIGVRTAVRRISRTAGAILSAAISVAFAAGQTKTNSASSLVQIDYRKPSVIIAVHDASGAVIARAHVSLVDETNKTEWTGLTDGSGRVQFSSLVPGSYLLTIESPGFETAHETVAISGQKMLDVQLAVDSHAQMGVVVSVEIGVDTQPIPLPDHIPNADDQSSPPSSKAPTKPLQK